MVSKWSKEGLGFHDLQRILFKLIDRVEVFEGFTQAELVQLLADAERCRFDAGEPIVAEGSSGTYLYVIVDGEVEVSKHGAGPFEAELARLGLGMSFGEMSMVDPAVRSATVTALTDCILIRIGERACERSPALGAKLYRNLARVLARRLRAANDRAIGHLS